MLNDGVDRHCSSRLWGNSRFYLELLETDEQFPLQKRRKHLTLLETAAEPEKSRSVIDNLQSRNSGMEGRGRGGGTSCFESKQSFNIRATYLDLLGYSYSKRTMEPKPTRSF